MKSSTIIPKMKQKTPLEKYRKKKKKKEDEWEIDESDFPVHEKYTKEEPVKE